MCQFMMMQINSLKIYFFEQYLSACTYCDCKYNHIVIVNRAGALAGRPSFVSVNSTAAIGNNKSRDLLASCYWR